MTERAPASPDVAASSPATGTGWATWWRAQSGARQALVPGAYAWAVTIAPLGWGHRAWYATAAASAGILSLAAGLIADRRAPDTARAIMGWGVVASGLLTWATVPGTAYEALDAARGIAGMLGWALFAFALGSPAQNRESVATTLGPGVAARSSARTDALVLTLALLLTVALQVPGWGSASRDRMVLVRIVAVGAGLAVVNAAGAIAASRHGDRKAPGRSSRRKALLWVIASAVLVGAGAAVGASQPAPASLDGR